METRSARKDDPMELCRTCMTAGRTKRKRKQVPIFTKLDDAFIANIITDCTGVQISKNDGLPAVICIDCFETVKLLAGFIKATRESDSQLHRLCQVEQLQDDGGPMETETDSGHLPEIKCETPVHMEDEIAEEEAIASDNDDFKPDNDTDSDWKGSDEEVIRSVKREKLDLESNPEPRKRNGSPIKRRRTSYVPKKPVQSEESLKLTDEERELFTVIEIPPNSHTCCGCLQIFESAEELDTHRQTTHVWKKEKLMKPMPSKHLCDGCLRRYDTPQGLNMHKKGIQLLKVIWECKKCKALFKLADKRRKHVKLHAEGMPVAMIVRFTEATQKKFGWICCALKCGQSFTTEKDLVDHAHGSHWADKVKADKESAEKPAQCQVCFRRFADRKKVVYHQRMLYYKHNNFQCSLCGLKFINACKLTAHEVKEHGSTAFQCKICDKTFTASNGLASHLEIVHNAQEKQHLCTVCGMKFKLRSNLKVHMEVHIEVAEFKCEVCPKEFKSKLRLQCHMRTHTGEKPYKCRICGHAFANHTNCRRHEMTHSGEKPHKCSYCEKSFILKRMLTEHESAHIGVEHTPNVREQQETAVVNQQETAVVDQQETAVVDQEVAEEEETVELVEIVDDDDDYDQAHSGSDVSYQHVHSMHNMATETTSNPVIQIQSASMAPHNAIASKSSSYRYVLKF